MNLNEPVSIPAGASSPVRLDARQCATFGAALLAIFAYLAWRNHDLFPNVFADEWLYDQFARLRPLSESTLPSYLYLKLFGATSACGTGFLACTRLLNSALFVASAPFVYLVARPLTGRGAAVAIAIASLLLPVNSYTAYFMPEALYYLCFWIVSWRLLAGASGLASAIMTGVLVGLMALVKVHALFLLPALCLFMLWRGWRDGGGRKGLQHGLVQGLLGALALALSALAVKSALGWLLAGPNGLNLFGTFYGNHAHNSEGALARLLTPALLNLQGHVLALALLFALPLMLFAASATSAPVRQALGRPGQALMVYTLLALGAALGMTVAYTATIATAGPLEGVRLHLRYYDFTFPLLAMVAAAPVPERRLALPLRLALALPFAALVAYAMLHLVPAYSLSFVDGPEIFAVAFKQEPRAIVTAVQLMLLALWAWRPEFSRKAYLWLWLPVFALFSSLVSHEVLHRSKDPNLYDRAALFINQTLTLEQRGELVVAGDSLAGLMRVQFHLDSASSSIIELPPGAPFEASQLPARKQFLLVVGSQPLPPEIKPEVQTPEYALVRIGTASRALHRIDFSKALAGGPVAGTAGLDATENWGTWSNSKQVVLNFTQPLPRRLVLFLNAQAFGPNVGKEFVLTVGDAQRRFKLPGGPQEQYFSIDTDGQQTSLTITVPEPSAPPGDPRLLGIGMVGLEIGER